MTGLSAQSTLDWQKGIYNWLGTTRPDDRPHVMPVWGVWIDDIVYFGTAPDSVKALNLASNPAAVVHLESGNDVVIVEGRTEVMVKMDADRCDSRQLR
jgi:hypothetical protein